MICTSNRRSKFFDYLIQEKDKTVNAVPESLGAIRKLSFDIERWVTTSQPSLKTPETLPKLRRTIQLIRTRMKDAESSKSGFNSRSDSPMSVPSSETESASEPETPRVEISQ